MIRKNDRLLLAVSGGPDSMALLGLSEVWKNRYALQIAVAHLNHGLLKTEAEKAERLVQTQAISLGFPFFSETVSIRKLAQQNKRSIEEMGRIMRYQFFEKIAKKTRSQKIVTAHTQNDQAETLLMRIIRGSGLRGLSGIPYERPIGKWKVIRPLLGCKKKDLLDFVKKNHIPFVKDPTNLKKQFTRNRIRHDLLPKLAKDFNPRIQESLVNLQTICSEAQDYLRSIALKALKRCLTKNTRRRTTLSLNLAPLKRLHPALLHEVLSEAIFLQKGDLNRLHSRHLSDITQMIRSSEKNLEIHLPNRVRVIKTKWLVDFVR